MFQFPAFARTGLCIQPAVTSSACTVTPGFPIRKSLDQSSFDSSPGLIAAYRVLHRLITPRHPPYTLSSLVTFVEGPARELDIGSPSRRYSCAHSVCLFPDGIVILETNPYALVKRIRSSLRLADPSGMAVKKRLNSRDRQLRRRLIRIRISIVPSKYIIRFIEKKVNLYFVAVSPRSTRL
jgi:hypothetical protein